MDQFMVNFENFTPNIGEEILIFGKNKANQISMENISETIKSTPYVVATGIKGRTQKEYKFWKVSLFKWSISFQIYARFLNRFFSAAHLFLDNLLIIASWCPYQIYHFILQLFMVSMCWSKWILNRCMINQLEFLRIKQPSIKKAVIWWIFRSSCCCSDKYFPSND